MIQAKKMAVLLALFCPAIFQPLLAADNQAAIQRGEYIYNLAGCESCHTNTEDDGEPLAGGVKLQTPFGTFYGPNISPDPKFGIGGWSDQDFIRALKQGISPRGDHYYPAFPYTSYSLMSDQELLDLKVYIDAQQPVPKASKAHKLRFPLEQRSLVGIWKWLNFKPQTFQPDPERSKLWNRGAYIVHGPGHCDQCHSPQTLTGGLDNNQLLAGTNQGPDGEQVPALRSDLNSELATWEIVDITFALETGLKPDGDSMEGSMGHVVENSTSRLNESDLRAIAEYIKSIGSINAGNK